MAPLSVKWARECVCVSPLRYVCVVLWCALPVWPCLSAITPLSGNIKIDCHGKMPWLRHSCPSPRTTKTPEWAGFTTYACSIHRLRGGSRCQDGNYHSNLNKWCKNSGCSNATTAALAYCSLVGLCIQGCASLKALQIRSTWEAH